MRRRPICDKDLLAKIVLIVFLLSMLPVIFVGIYAHPTGDDILYGVDARLAWAETGSLFQTIAAAAEGVSNDYYRWQGTFTALFLMRLQPTVFSESLYFLTPIMILGLLLSGLYYSVRKIAKYIVPFTRWETIGVWSVFALLMIQLVFAPGEAFYWFNGGMYYVGFFGIMLWGGGIVIEYVQSRKKRFLLEGILIAVLLGGSNYVTLLLSILAMTLLVIGLFIERNKAKWGCMTITMTMVMCFAISAIAPGNAVRQGLLASLPAHKAILFSLWQGFGYMNIWLKGWWVIGALLLLLWWIPAVRRTKYEFRYPIVVILLLYGLFCSMQCPTMYAESSTGPARVINIIYFGFILFSYLSLGYLVGWIVKMADKRAEMKVESTCCKKVWTVVFVISLVAQIGISVQSEQVKEITAIMALRDIFSGRAKAYDAEYDERIQLLENSISVDVVLEPYENRPVTVYVGDYSGDPTQDSNQALARWYHKNSVLVDYE